MSRHFGGAPRTNPNKARVALVLSTILLLIFSAVAYKLLTAKPDETNLAAAQIEIDQSLPELKMVNVVVTRRKIEEGEQINSNMLDVESRPQIGVDPRAAREVEQVQGMFTRMVLLPGQPIRLDSISRIKPSSAIATKIPAGFRAISISVDNESSVESWAKPGSRVDVNLIADIQGSQGVITIVHNAEILSANRQVATEKETEEPAGPVLTSVTLLVTAKDAKAIKLGQTIGKLDLALRGDRDAGKVDDGDAITIPELLQATKKDTNSKVAKGGILTVGGKKFIIGADGTMEPMDAIDQ